MRDGRVLTTRIEVHTYLGLNVLSFCSRGGGGGGGGGHGRPGCPYGAGPEYNYHSGLFLNTVTPTASISSFG